MAEGNGVDLGTIVEMVKGLTLAVDRLGVAFTLMDERLGRMEVRLDRLEVRLDRVEVRLDRVELGLDRMDARLDRMKDDLAGQIAGLRSEVVTYHGTVMGHGILITEPDERITRLENERFSTRGG